MAFKMSPIGKKKCSYSPMQEKGLISPMLKEGEEPKGKVGQAVENFKTRNELVSYKKGDSNTVVVTTKKKARKAEKKEEKTQSSAPKSSKSKSSKYKPAKVKATKAKYGIQKGKKGYQKKRTN
jgi:hypothetical protein